MCKCVERNSWNIRYEIFRLVYVYCKKKLAGQNKYHIFGTFFAIFCQIMFANFSSQLLQSNNKLITRYYWDKCRLKFALRYLLVGLHSLYSYLLLNDGFFAMYSSLIIIAPYDFLNYTLSIKTGRLMLKLAKRFNENHLSMVKQWLSLVKELDNNIDLEITFVYHFIVDIWPTCYFKFFPVCTSMRGKLYTKLPLILVLLHNAWFNGRKSNNKSPTSVQITTVLWSYTNY